MDQAVQRGKPLRGVENLGRQAFPVDGAVGTEDAFAELTQNAIERLPAGQQYPVSQFIRRTSACPTAPRAGGP